MVIIRGISHFFNKPHQAIPKLTKQASPGTSSSPFQALRLCLSCDTGMLLLFNAAGLFGNLPSFWELLPLMIDHDSNVARFCGEEPATSCWFTEAAEVFSGCISKSRWIYQFQRAATSWLRIPNQTSLRHQSQPTLESSHQLASAALTASKRHTRRLSGAWVFEPGDFAACCLDHGLNRTSTGDHNFFIPENIYIWINIENTWKNWGNNMGGYGVEIGCTSKM